MEAATLLAGLGQKFETGDRQAYLDAFVPDVQSEQGEIFDRMRALPLVAMTLAPGGGGTLEGDQLLGYQATWAYRVRDVPPPHIFGTKVTLDFKRDAGRWRIASIEGEVPFWAYGPAEARRVGAFWIFFRPAAEPQVTTIGDEATAALETVKKALPDRASPVYVMFVAESAEEFAMLTGRNPEHFLGAAVSRYQIGETGIEVSGGSFYLNGAAFRADSRQNRQQTMVHELTHLVLAPRTMPFTPVWLVEGMAMEVAEDLPVVTMRAAYDSGNANTWSLQAFTGKRAFGALDSSGEQTAIDYAYAAYLARYLVATYGFDHFVAFYDSFADVPFEAVRDGFVQSEGAPESDEAMGGLAQRLTPEKLQAAFGIDLPALERDFKAWLATQMQ
jgi:hypothetical protein